MKRLFIIGNEKKVMMSQIDLKVCYTCLNFSKQLVDLQQYDDDDKITYLTKLSCLATSGLVTQDSMEICIQCVADLRTAYKFHETVACSQATFKKYLEECEYKSEESENTTQDEKINSDGLIRIHSRVVEVTDQVQGETSSRLLDKNINCSSQGYSSDGDDEMYYSSDSKPLGIKREENVLCERCRKFFSSEGELDTHCCFRELTESSEEIQDETGNCVKKNDTKHLEKSKVSYQCGFCNAIFEKRWQMRKHISRLHQAHENFICAHCGRGFKQSYHLKEHLTSHTGEKNFPCSFCDKKFQRLSSVKRHMKSHDAPPGQKTKKTPFLCTVCGKSFPFSNGVQRHLRVHLGIKRHECNICHRKFTQSTHLHVHMRTHTGERPYICDFCGETFSLKATLQKHISSLHVPEEAFAPNFYTDSSDDKTTQQQQAFQVDVKDCQNVSDALTFC